MRLAVHLESAKPPINIDGFFLLSGDLIRRAGTFQAGIQKMDFTGDVLAWCTLPHLTAAQA